MADDRNNSSSPNEGAQVGACCPHPKSDHVTETRSVWAHCIGCADTTDYVHAYRPDPDGDLIPIDKGIPLPTRQSNRKKYPFDAMEVGDSFFVPKRDGENSSRQAQARVASCFARQRPRKYTTAMVPGGVRVWRVK
jgi:hypothetical protein